MFFERDKKNGIEKMVLSSLEKIVAEIPDNYLVFQGGKVFTKADFLKALKNPRDPLTLNLARAFCDFRVFQLFHASRVPQILEQK